MDITCSRKLHTLWRHEDLCGGGGGGEGGREGSWERRGDGRELRTRKAGADAASGCDSTTRIATVPDLLAPSPCNSQSRELLSLAPALIVLAVTDTTHPADESGHVFSRLQDPATKAELRSVSEVIGQ